MTIDKKLSSLEVKKDEACERMNDVNRRINARRMELEKGVRDQLNAEFGIELAASKTSYFNARKEFDDALHARSIAHAQKEMPYPEGTILYKWEKRSSYGPFELNPNKKGVFQIFRKDDSFVGGVWKQPPVGSTVVRLLLKNGQPGKKVIRIFKTDTMWLPEGITHPQALK